MKESAAVAHALRQMCSGQRPLTEIFTALFQRPLDSKRSDFIKPVSSAPTTLLRVIAIVGVVIKGLIKIAPFFFVIQFFFRQNCFLDVPRCN